MIGFRPRSTPLFLERPRLLRLLPEEPGYVVWLEAPYGYGKSVLTSQWAARLEEGGWRVVWLALVGEVRPSLALVLGLPPDTPWVLLLAEIERGPTVLILEDLEVGEELGPLLKHNPGLILLASRQPLAIPELPRLRAEGRLVHLRAEHLAFTLEEARQLFPDRERAEAAWERTGGWSLPLHLAALTGELPESKALLEGVRESLSPAEWEEALFLASLRFLPKEKARPETARLAEAGFVQGLEAGYRLHPLAAEALFRHYPTEVRAGLRRELGRLEPLQRGEALERAGLRLELGLLLEAHPELSLYDPQAVLRWDGVAGGQRNRSRMAAVGDALCALGRHAEGLPLLLAAARWPEASPEEALGAYRDAVWHLGEQDPAQAKAVTAEAEPLLAQVSPISAARFLNNVSHIYFQTQEYPQAEVTVRQALALLPSGHPRRFPLLLNLGILRWNHAGDLETRLATAQEALQRGHEFIAQQAAVAHLDLGRYEWLLGHRQAALAHWQEAEQRGLAQPWSGLEAAALQAIYTGRFEGLPRLVMQLSAWERPLFHGRVVAFWALELVNRGEPEAALGILDLYPGSDLILTRAVRALALARTGKLETALEVLGSPPSERDREQALHWQAARYRILRQEEALETLLALTQVGERILPGLIPLDELPRGRPELARGYALEALLHSGWKGAIALRIEEIPPLEVRGLGGLEVRVLGEHIALSQRPRDLLLLLLLGQRREAIIEAIWPEAEPEKGRNNFYVNLNGLRRSLEPWGVPTYVLEDRLVRTRCDVWELEAALVQNHPAEIVRLYTGKLAPEVDLPLLNEAREALHERVLGTLLAAATGAPMEQAEAYLEHLLELEPLHEEALSRLLRLLIQSGRRSRAQRRYQAFARRLEADLGLEPPLELRGLLD
ncbi:MAG: transcriptional regulator [Thermaceae bacterium]|nr:transcriptional regulator [Thermaceae bacterium]